MNTAIYPGSFDPVTNGHMDILAKASSIFDKVIVAVLKNTAKKSFLPVEIKKQLIEDACKNLTNVEVEFFDGLTVDFAKSKNAKVLIRGLRSVKDFEYEIENARINSCLDKKIQTIFLLPEPENSFISSSAVREAVLFGADISGFVPKNVKDYLLTM